MKLPDPSQAWLALAGRVCIAALFLPSGIAKIANFGAMAGFIASKGLPFPPLLAGCALLLEIAASLAVLAGWHTRWAALALVVFTLAAGVLFHNFWALPDAMAAMMQRQAFFKNIGIAGGLLLLAALGPGRLSLDARRAP